MAGAAIPIIAAAATAAAPFLTPLLTSLIQHVEASFPSGTGGDKMKAVVNAALSVIQPLGTAGIVPGASNLDFPAIASFAQSIFTTLKNKGRLPAPLSAGAKSPSDVLPAMAPDALKPGPMIPASVPSITSSLSAAVLPPGTYVITITRQG